MYKPQFEMLAGKDGKFYFRLKASNGEVVLSGRGYKTKSETIHAIASVMRYGGMEGRFVRKETLNRQFYFQLKAPSGQLLGWSEMYHSEIGRDNGIIAVRRAVQFGRVFDLN
jgi:uncharacterized protein